MNARKTITDRQAKNIKANGQRVHTGITGFVLLPSNQNGKGQWLLRYISPATGKRREMHFGVYPDVTVAYALKQAQAAREQIAMGNCPLEQRRTQESRLTFMAAAIKRWEQVHPSFKNEKVRIQWLTRLERHIFPLIGERYIDTLTPQDIASALAPIWNEIPETARNIRQQLSDIFNVYVAIGTLASNPAALVHQILPKQTAKVQHQPAMPWRDIASFLTQHITDKQPLLGARAALIFLILTATRSGEVRGATWNEIDFQKGLWTIPATRMKMDIAHRVPLSTHMLDLLENQKKYGLHEELIFTNTRGGALSDMALTKLLRDCNAPSDTTGRTATAHGFRSSFRNWAADMGYDTELAERALAHQISNKVQAAYERTDRLEARIVMMESWGNTITPFTTSL